MASTASTDTKHLFGETHIELLKFSYTWKISNSSFVFKDVNRVHSGSFEMRKDYKWQLYIFQTKGYVRLGLEYLGKSSSYTERCSFLSASVEFQFSVLRSSKEVRLGNPTFQTFDDQNKTYTTSTYMTVSQLLEYGTGSGDTLTFVWRAVLQGNEFYKNIDPATTAVDSVTIPPCQLLQDIGALLKDQQLADVTLVVEGQNLKAHKAFLAARSPVFAAMFNTDMAENRRNEVIITDMEYEVAQQMLQFIYTGKAENGSKVADRLLAAADKYGLARLKAECERIMCDTISASTAISTLVLADRHIAQQLKTRTMQFIKANADKVMEGDGVESMIEEHPKLMVELYRALAMK